MKNTYLSKAFYLIGPLDNHNVSGTASVLFEIRAICCNATMVQAYPVIKEAGKLRLRSWAAYHGLRSGLRSGPAFTVTRSFDGPKIFRPLTT